MEKQPSQTHAFLLGRGIIKFASLPFGKYTLVYYC